jgi:fatty-acid desaturase
VLVAATAGEPTDERRAGVPVHHVTFSMNSPCHFFGRRTFATGDQSRNLAWLAPLAFGEAWQNNHHAFPTSARHGVARWQVDPGVSSINALDHELDLIQQPPAILAVRR